MGWCGGGGGEGGGQEEGDRWELGEKKKSRMLERQFIDCIH